MASVANDISSSPLADGPGGRMLEDSVVKELVRSNNYSISLNTKFRLG